MNWTFCQCLAGFSAEQVERFFLQAPEGKFNWNLVCSVGLKTLTNPDQIRSHIQLLPWKPRINRFTYALVRGTASTASGKALRFMFGGGRGWVLSGDGRPGSFRCASIKSLWEKKEGYISSMVLAPAHVFMYFGPISTSTPETKKKHLNYVLY